MLSGGFDAGSVDEDTDDEGKAVGLSGGADVGQAGAVGGVEADGAEAGGSDDFDVRLNVGSISAGTIGIVWGVGDGKVVAVA